MRFSEDRVEKELIPLVKKAADEISTKLGYHK
jgi:DNA-binding IclR family transcriptional regulator